MTTCTCRGPKSEVKVAAANRRWQQEPHGLDKRIDALIRRAPALTPDQIRRLRQLVASLEGDRP